MKANISEFPKPPQPRVPDAPSTRIQPPTPVIYERVQWEYKVVEKNLADGPMCPDELNALGKQGWELTGVVTNSDSGQFYFKRTTG